MGFVREQKGLLEKVPLRARATYALNTSHEIACRNYRQVESMVFRIGAHKTKVDLSVRRGGRHSFEIYHTGGVRVTSGNSASSKWLRKIHSAAHSLPVKAWLRDQITTSVGQALK